MPLSTTWEARCTPWDMVSTKSPASSTPALLMSTTSRTGPGSPWNTRRMVAALSSLLPPRISSTPQFDQTALQNPRAEESKNSGSDLEDFFQFSEDGAPPFLKILLLVSWREGTIEHEVTRTTYMVDHQRNAAAMAKAKDEFIKEPYPASTWIGVTELVIPGTRAEIKVTARKNP